MGGPPIPPDLLDGLIKARELVRREYAQPLTLSDMARTAGLSPFHFLRTFRALYGQTPGRYLTRMRLEAARDHLAAGASVTEACFLVGYESLGSFSTRFARELAQPPSEFRRRIFAVGALPYRRLALRVPYCFAKHHAAI